MIVKMAQLSRTLSRMDAVGIVAGHLNAWMHRNRIAPLRSSAKSKSCNHKRAFDIEVEQGDCQTGYENRKFRYFFLGH